jgi:hypothetical protein
MGFHYLANDNMIHEQNWGETIKIESEIESLQNSVEWIEE